MLPFIVQTAGVFLVKLTGKPDEALALNAKGGSPSCLSVGLAKVILWSLFCGLVTAKDCATGGAGLKNSLPGWAAWIVQVPVVISVTVLPLTVQTAGVSEAKLTGKPEEAVALTVNGGSLTSLSGNGLKLIVWSLWSTGVNS